MSFDDDELHFMTGCEVTHPNQLGGQHVAMRCCGVRVMHVREGIAVTVTTERSQYKNRERAVAMLRSLVEPERRAADRYIADVERIADVVDQFRKRHGVVPEGATQDLVAACYRLIAAAKPEAKP